MKDKILLYGATGFSGRLVARTAMRRWSRPGQLELLLGGRDGNKLGALARELGAQTGVFPQTRIFGLDDPVRVDAALSEPGLLAVINAAGPFARTAIALAKSALRTGVHYVDINGEADVYTLMDDLGFIAKRRGVTLVAGAGHSATTSDVMLDYALRRLAKLGITEVGTVRIAFSHVKYLSKGSAQTAWRSIREQVTVMREPAKSTLPRSLIASHVPTGQIERTFDFGDLKADRREDGARAGKHRIATAANLLDLFTARLTAQRHMQSQAPKHVERVHRIEAYLEMPEGARIFTQFESLSAPWLAFPAVRRMVEAQVNLLPEGPNEQERANDRHTVLLEIDDGFGRPLIDWRMETPDPYDFTADCVLGVTETLKTAVLPGWRTPSEMLQIDMPNYVKRTMDIFAKCIFEARFTVH